MRKRRKPELQFVVCIDNKGYKASLEIGKLYRVIADEEAAAHGYLRVIDETGGVLPGVTVALRQESQQPRVTVTGPSGVYSFDGLPPGTYELSLTLINFASVNHRDPGFDA